MGVEIIRVQPGGRDTQSIRRVAAALAEGAVVVIPTETVYGVAASAAHADAVKRLQAIKERASSQNFTVHIGSKSDSEQYVPAMSALGRRLVRKGWPGPLTLIFPVAEPRKAAIYERLSRPGIEAVFSSGSVGLRCPDHPDTELLLREAGVPVIASSANARGEPPPTDAESAARQLPEGVDIIVDGGQSRYGRPSTIVRVEAERYELVRAGVLDERTIDRLSSLTVLFVCTGNTCRSPMAEAIFRRMVAERLGCGENELGARGIQVQSAGTMGHGGGRVSAEAVEVCRRRGLEIGGHRTQGLSVELLHAADHIYTMSKHHLEVVRSMAPAKADRAKTLDETRDVADPIGGPVQEYERAADAIESALRSRMDEVLS